MTTEEAVRKLLADPEMHDRLRDSYLARTPLEDARVFADSEEFAATLELIGKPLDGLVIADIGAGRGISAFGFAQAGAEKIFAIEPDPSDLVGQGAIRGLGMGNRIEIVGTWGEQLSLPTGSVDIAHVRQVLHHARDLDQLVKECARILKPGGVFVACREHVADNDRQLQEFFTQHPVHQLAGGEYAFRLDQYVGAMERAGFCDIRVLAPWDSIICAFPAVRSRQELADRPRNSLRKRFGFVGALLGAFPPIRALVLNQMNSRPTPGRMYSFKCTKPS